MISSLQKIADEMSSLLSEFRDGGNISGLILPTEHKATFKRLAIEAKSEIDEVLGYGNDFSLNLVNAINSGAQGFSGGPSYASVSEAAEIVRGAVRFSERRRERPSNLKPGSVLYVDQTVITALSSNSGGRWDFLRLVELCRELNVAAANECHMATAMIVRAIVDHVPPVFGCKSFGEVANSYSGSRSFREHMSNLDKSLRKVADGYLHTQVRSRESVPGSVQVDFRAAVAELLSEVIRIVRS